MYTHKIVCDAAVGSGSGDPRGWNPASGWAFVEDLRSKTTKQILISRRVLSSDSSLAECCIVRKAFETLPFGSKVILVCDCQAIPHHYDTIHKADLVSPFKRELHKLYTFCKKNCITFHIRHKDSDPLHGECHTKANCFMNYFMNGNQFYWVVFGTESRRYTKFANAKKRHKNFLKQGLDSKIVLSRENPLKDTHFIDTDGYLWIQKNSPKSSPEN